MECVVTGPVARFARQIAGQGYIVAAPSTYHEFTGPEALSYNAEDTEKGNEWKASKVRSKEPIWARPAAKSINPFLSIQCAVSKSVRWWC